MTNTLLDSMDLKDPATASLLGNSEEEEVVPQIDFTHVQTQEGVEKMIQELTAEAEVTNDRVLALDTETTGLDPYTSELLLLQIGSYKQIYVIECQKVDVSPLKQILEDPAWLVIAHNAKFDFKMLKQRAGISLANMFDTYLAERLLTAGIPDARASLAVVAKKYLNVTLHKEVRKGFINKGVTQTFSPDELRYAAYDVVILHEIFEKQFTLLKKYDLLRVARLEFVTIKPVADMELAGCKVDVPKWRGIMDEVTAKRDALEKELSKILSKFDSQLSMFGATSFNLNSPIQLKEAFSKLGVSLEDTNEASLKMHENEHPAVKLLLEYRGHEKILSAYGESFLAHINPVTGRIHSDFEQYGADTGRFSCRNPNIQQIPATSEFRHCIVAEPGYKLVVADYSQVELRILADLSQDPGFMEAFLSDGDLHALTASRMFGVPLEEVSKQRRKQAKSINFGLAYGRGAASLAVQLEVDKDEAEKLIEQYFKAYQGVKKWLEHSAKTAVDKLCTTTVTGRRRVYQLPPKNDPNYKKERSSVERKGKNTPIQGTSADITKYALIFVHNGLKGLDAKMVNCVHDEIVVEAREEIADQVAKILEKGMIDGAEVVLKKCPIKVEAQVADFWSK